MKAIIVALLIVLAAAYLTKPSDEKCVAMIRDRMERAQVPQYVIKEQYTRPSALRFEDHYVYKTIYSTIDGHRVGHAAFGAVIMD